VSPALSPSPRTFFATGGPANLDRCWQSSCATAPVLCNAARACDGLLGAVTTRRSSCRGRLSVGSASCSSTAEAAGTDWSRFALSRNCLHAVLAGGVGVILGAAKVTDIAGRPTHRRRHHTDTRARRRGIRSGFSVTAKRCGHLTGCQPRALSKNQSPGTFSRARICRSGHGDGILPCSGFGAESRNPAASWGGSGQLR